MTAWSELHASARFRPRYPSEHAVRWAASLPGTGLALDIGAGAGRHARLLQEFGYDTVATDISLEGLRHCPGARTQASMTALPFRDGTFDAALAYGSWYYASWFGMLAAASEVHRVLKDGGHAFVVLRTTDDCRYQKGDVVVPAISYRLTTADTNEQGMVVSFLREYRLHALFEGFSSIAYERCDTTRNGRQQTDSEWLIALRK